MKKPRPPRAPYCLCGSLRRWILQQVSPSRYFTYYFSGVNRRANAYFAKLKDYRTKLIQYRVELRICSRLGRMLKMADRLKTSYGVFEQDDFVEDSGQLRELTVTITLSEYRELVRAAVYERARLDQVDRQQLVIDTLGKLLLTFIPDFSDNVREIVNLMGGQNEARAALEALVRSVKDGDADA